MKEILHLLLRSERFLKNYRIYSFCASVLLNTCQDVRLGHVIRYPKNFARKRVPIIILIKPSFESFFGKGNGPTRRQKKSKGHTRKRKLQLKDNIRT